MIMQVFAIYDAAISTWKPPMCARAKGEILRWWIEMVNNPQTELAKHPGDFTLFHIGTWDDATCKFDLLKTPVSIGLAIEFLKKDDQVTDK